jgi:hypothetical protein
VLLDKKPRKIGSVSLAKKFSPRTIKGIVAEEGRGRPTATTNGRRQLATKSGPNGFSPSLNSLTAPMVGSENYEAACLAVESPRLVA